MGDERKPEVTPRQAAKALAVTPRSIFNYIKKGKLSARKEGNRVFIPIAEIENLRMKASQESEKAPPQLPEFSPLGAETALPGSIHFQFDPSRHLIVERNHYEGLLTKLGHYELEVKMLKDERPWWKRIFRK